MSWAARVLVYSGRPDPSWVPDPRTVRSLMTLWDRLPPAVPPPPRSNLGYRGALLVAPDGTTWLAAEGTVERSGRGARESRGDESGRFERLLLGSAPSGLLPRALLDRPP